MSRLWRKKEQQGDLKAFHFLETFLLALPYRPIHLPELSEMHFATTTVELPWSAVRSFVGIGVFF